MKKSILKTVSLILLVLAIMVSSIFLIGRYGWKLGGFNACETAGIEPEKLAVPVVYEPILKQYRSALEERWTGQQLVDAGLNFMIKDVPSEAVGYAVDDLDDDGVPEIVIGTIAGDEFYGKLVFVLYTVDDDGEPVQIFSSIERDRYYYAGDVRFANLGSSAFDDSYVTTLKLEGEGLVDMTFTTDPEDYVQMQLVPIAEGENEG